MTRLQLKCSAASAARRKAWMIAAAISLALTASAKCEDRMVLGPDQFKEDKSGAGSVLCVWSLYLSVQALTAACALPRRPVDDAIDRAIVAIDEFILANSSLHPTRSMLEQFKREAAEGEVSSVRRWRGPEFCKNDDFELFRSPAPKKIEEGVKELLAVPREPVINPCL